MALGKGLEYSYPCISGLERGFDHMNVRQIARAAVLVALLTVASWVSIPLGPVPFTLQTMALALLPAVLDGVTACVAVGVYLLLGALGLPVFAGFGSGMASIAGPTGGFLWGFLLGTAVAGVVVKALGDRVPRFVGVLVADIAMLLVAYACGTAQLMAVAQLDLVPALMLAVVPFLVPDAIKLVVGARIGCTVAKSLSLAV